MRIWDFVVTYRIDLIIGAVFALIFALIVDFLQPASRLRAAVRHFRNKLAEASVAELRQRIAQQERYREAVASFLASDKSLYLATLQYIIGMLLFICGAAAFVLVNELIPVRLAPVPSRLFALLFLALAVVLGAYGLRTASWDTPSKISEVIVKLEKEIAEMKAKLEARTRT
jgi:hypothetical protein